MKFTATLNGVKVTKQIPIRYSELTFGKHVELAFCDPDPVKVLALLVDIDAELLRKVKIANLEEVLAALSFLDQPMSLPIPKEILGYKIPKDLKFESMNRYADIQTIASSFSRETFGKEDLKKYAEIVSIYAMPNYEDATEQAKQDFIQQFFNAPCEEVMAVGNFTLVKLTALKLNMPSNFQNRGTLISRLLLGFKAWRSRMAFSSRYAGWRRKLRTEGMKF